MFGLTAGFVWLGLGVIAFCVLIWLRHRALHLYRNGVITTARVIRSSNYRYDFTNKPILLFWTVVGFVDNSGRNTEGRLILDRKYAPDVKIEIRYDPDHPKRVALARPPRKPEAGLLSLGDGWVIVLALVSIGTVNVLAFL